MHPGYGFLAENEDFAAACRDAGLIFIGPSPEAITLMGSKTAARQVAIAAGVPVVPGTEDPLSDAVSDGEVLAIAEGIGYPLMLKAVAGGGGKGMRMVSQPADLPGALRAARSEAGSAFGDGAVYLERRIMAPRHIEVQLLGDHHGTVLPFVERECSIQRRHQKVVEESPSLAVSPELRRRMTSAAAAVAKRAGYTNAGTIEFLLDEDGSFYFLEMNTRLQVEHPITEMVTGVDLVQWQIRIARGERLTLDPEALLMPRCHAIECRIYAEDPDNGFMPSPGRIQGLRVPQGPGVRDDSGALRGRRGADLLRPDDLEADHVGRGSPERARAHEAGAGRVPRCAASAPRFRSSSGFSRTRTSRRGASTPPSSIASSRGNGQPLDPANEDHAVLGAIAVAVRQLTAAAVSAAETPAAASRWQQSARAGALR